MGVGGVVVVTHVNSWLNKDPFFIFGLELGIQWLMMVEEYLNPIYSWNGDYSKYSKKFAPFVV